jgi:hypothetical protein
MERRERAGSGGGASGAAEIVQVVHGERGIFGGEFDIVVVAGETDQFHERRPGGQHMRADGRFAGIEQRT